MKILHIDSSPFVGTSVTRELSAIIVAELMERNPTASVAYRDLGTQPPAHLSAAAMSIFHNANDEEVITPVLQQEIDSIYQSIEEVMASDVIVIGAPMYNHSISSNLKAWIDQISQKGITFTYTPEGVKGLVSGKKVFIASSRGGIYSSEEGRLHDFQEPYLLSILALMGMTDVSVICAEGVSMRAIGRNVALVQAQSALQQVLSTDILAPAVA